MQYFVGECKAAKSKWNSQKKFKFISSIPLVDVQMQGQKFLRIKNNMLICVEPFLTLFFNQFQASLGE